MSHKLILGNSFPAQICRSVQKDTTSIQSIYNDLSELSKTIKGVSFVIRYQPQLLFASRLLYYSLTSLLNNQTLGEEYCNLLLCYPSDKLPPSKSRLVVLSLLQSIGPYFFGKLRTLWLGINASDAIRELSLTVRTYVIINLLLSTFEHIHLCLFYLEGRYYHLSKRLLGLQYMWIHNAGQTQPQNVIRSFRLLGFVFSTQLALRVIAEYRNGMTRINREINTSYKQLSEDQCASVARDCVLCLEKLRHPSLTPCGHVFCWECIHQACCQNAECPLCKASLKPSRIICLQNY